MSKPLGTLEAAVVAAVEQAAWITATDGPAVTLARHYAAVIDSADEPQKAAYLGPHLLNALKALGLSPEARKALEIETKKAGSPVDELKQRRQRRDTA